ncbi:MAG: hypothetical protein QW628_12520 [Thermofilum sp.]
MGEIEMRAQSDLVSIVIISAIIVAAGITLWIFYSGYASAARLSAQNEVNRELSILRSVISADYVLCPQGEALLRNVGKEPVVIFRLIVYKNGELVWDSLRIEGIKKLAEIDVGKKGGVRFTCPASYSKDDVITLQVHYIPKSLFDPSLELVDPSSDVLLFKVANFKAEEVSLALAGRACPDEPKNWAWIDFVDPEEAPPDGKLGQRIGIRLPDASGVFTLDLKVSVKGVSGSASTTASITSTSDETQWISIDMSGMRYPVTITFEATSPEDSNVLQREWYFNAIDTSYINYVQLIWNKLDKKLVGAYVSAFHRISGTYRVTVKAIDCFGNLVSEGNSLKDVNVGAAGRWEEYYVTFASGEVMPNVRRIEVYVEDLSAFVTEILAEYVTVTVTVTETSTHWVTQPMSTVTETLRTTTTRTTTVPMVTSTITHWVTLTSATTTTITSTSIRTITRSTVTQTTSVTATSTTTRYLSTVTVTATTTRSTTTTSYSTVFHTTTVSTPTATQTVTSTSTTVTTIPTTTASYTITTTSTTTSTPPPVTSTVTTTQATTVATSTARTTTTVGTTVTSITTQTVTVTACPTSSSQPSPIYAALAALFFAPAITASTIMRRCRR